MCICKSWYDFDQLKKNYYNFNERILFFFLTPVFSGIAINGLTFVGNLLESSGKIKPMIKIKDDFHLLGSKKSQWMQLINALGAS